MIPGLIVELAVHGRPVLLVGAGSVGRRRAERLLALGADLRWVAPDAPAEHFTRPFRASDCDGMHLIVACGPPTVNNAVEREARARGVLFSRADGASDWRWLAELRRGALRDAVSTSGRAPGAARALRRALAERVPAAWTDLVDQVAALRDRWSGRTDRAERLRAALGGPLAAVVESGRPVDPVELARWIEQVEASD